MLRDCLSGEVLLARSLLGATEADLVPLLREVADALPVPIRGVVSGGQASIRNAVRAALPDVPHQLCQSHYLREAAKPVFEADRHAKVQLKKAVRGVRPIERALEGRDDAEADAARGYCFAVRSVLTDDGRPPLCASGLKLHDRLSALHASLAQVGLVVAAAGARLGAARGQVGRAASEQIRADGRAAQPDLAGDRRLRPTRRGEPDHLLVQALPMPVVGCGCGVRGSDRWRDR